MSTNSVNNKRIAKNTLLLYFRMMFLMLISLYTSRVILHALGVTDYGIYNVVGGFVSMFALISAALTSACSRFLNFELGKGDKVRQNIVFSTAVSIQWGLALIVLVLSEIIGIWYVNNVMELPVERLPAANWCFQFSIITFCTNLITVPYNASIIAHERMKTFAYVGIFQGLVQLGISFLVFWEPFDRLVFYALLLMLLQLSIQMMYQRYCLRHFQECRYRFVFEKTQLKSMLIYSVWHLIGNGATVLKNHGVNLVLNLYYGPVINAAKGIATQVDSAVNLFVSNFMMAMNPQITQSYAKGDYKYMLNLVNKGACFSFYLILFLSLPLIINADYVMHLWLKEVPDYTVLFVQLTLISMVIQSLSRPLITAQNATGDVRDYQLVVGGINLLNLPMSWLFLHWGYTPACVMVVAIGVNIVALAARVVMLPFTLKFFVRKDFVMQVVLKCLCVAIVASIIPIVVSMHQMTGFLNFVMNVLVCFISSAITILYIGCRSSERAFAYSKINNLISRVKS